MASEQLADIRDRFQRGYRGMLHTLLRKGLPAAVCTIYDPRYPEPMQRRVGTAALCIINDAIIREAATQSIEKLAWWVLSKKIRYLSPVAEAPILF